MRIQLLLDNNLSFKLVQRLRDVCPLVTHVRDVQLDAASDTLVWEFAKRNGYVIVSKDNDFHQRSFVEGHPPKVIWIRLGNCTTDDIEHLIRVHWSSIAQFVADDTLSFLALG